jgi:hypothetical protein
LVLNLEDRSARSCVFVAVSVTIARILAFSRRMNLRTLRLNCT